MAREFEPIRTDLAGVGPDPALSGTLTSLTATREFRIPDGEPDIRGWQVRTLSGVELGAVDDLLFDEHREEVVLVDIDLKNSGEHVNMPIRNLQIDRARHCVIVDTGELDRFRSEHARSDAADDDQIREDDRASDAHVIEEVVVRRRMIDGEAAAREEL